MQEIAFMPLEVQRNSFSGHVFWKGIVEQSQ